MNKTDENGYTHARTCVYKTKYHIVFCTKYGNKVLTELVEEKLLEIFNEIAEKHDFQILTVGVGLDDHIHIMIQSHPKNSITNIVRQLKGQSAARLFEEFPNLKESYWSEFNRQLWSPSYFVETLGDVNEDAIKAYIKKQRA